MLSLVALAALAAWTLFSWLWTRLVAVRFPRRDAGEPVERGPCACAPAGHRLIVVSERARRRAPTCRTAAARVGRSGVRGRGPRPGAW